MNKYSELRLPGWQCPVKYRPYGKKSRWARENADGDEKEKTDERDLLISRLWWGFNNSRAP
jgi:hypothetical protein